MPVVLVGSWGRTGWQTPRCSVGPGGWKLSHHHELAGWHQLRTPPHVWERFSGATIQEVLLAPNSALGWILLFSQCTHSQQEYPGLKRWEKDVQTNLSKTTLTLLSDVFTLIERRTLTHTYPAYPRWIGICQSISANLARSHRKEWKSCHLQDILHPSTFCYDPAQPQKATIPTKHPLLLEDPAGLHLGSSEPCNNPLLALSIQQPYKCRGTIFCLLWVNKWIFMEVQGHSRFLMLSYFVPKFLSPGIRSLCSEVWSYQLLYFSPHFYPFCIILLK